MADNSNNQHGAQAYPLTWPHGWPRTTSDKRAQSRFTSSYDRATRKLADELRKLGATSVVVSSELPVTKSGVPYADAARRRITDPGVAVYFMFRDQSRVMARDSYQTVHENIMSVAHAVEHMRGIARHGGDHMMVQAFTGFLALPAPGHASEQTRHNPTYAKKRWYEVLGLLSHCRNKSDIELAYRIKAKTAHPDGGGSIGAMHELINAKEEGLRLCM